MKKRRRLCFWSLLFCFMVAMGPLGICAADGESTENADMEEILPPDNISSKGYDVALCIDNSRSMWEQQELRDQAVRSICNLAIGGNIRIGGVYFGDTVYKSLGLTSMEEQEGSLEVLQSFLNETQKGEENQNGNIAAGLEAAKGLFEDQDASRNRIIILFTSGVSTGENREDIREQAEILEQEQIPLYCVYLQSGRDDEEYIREMVNYFQEDNAFDEERFKKVTESQSDELSREFSEIFYAMQNDMKYRDVSVDSMGKMSFYVPSLGVEKLQVFLDGTVECEAVLDSPTDEPEDVFLWTDGKSAFVTVNNPTVGDWTLDIIGENRELVKGSIAYYAYLSAEINLDTQGEEQILRVKFYDRDGESVEVNPGAEITAEILFEGDEPGYKRIPLSSETEEWTSDGLLLEKTGDCQIEVNVQYEDFINLSYSTEETVNPTQAPIKEKQKDTQDKTLIVAAVIAVLAVMGGSIAFLVFRKGRREQLYKDVQEQREKLERKYFSVLQAYKRFAEAADRLEGTSRLFYENYQSFQRGYAEELPEEVLTLYGLDNSFDEKRREWIRTEVSKAKNTAYENKVEISKKRQELKNPEKDTTEPVLREIHKEIKVCYEQLGFLEDFLRKEMVEISRLLKIMEKDFKDFSWSREALEKMLNTPIACSLSLNWKGAFGSYRQNSGTEMVSCYYMLDEMALNIDNRKLTLEEALKGRKTGIWVFGFQKEQKEGLEIRSTAKFAICEDGKDEKPKEYRRAILLKGRRYRIQLENREFLTLEVE